MAVRLRDIWGFAESQETLGMSPEMFEVDPVLRPESGRTKL
jgi:hypothetical protein